MKLFTRRQGAGAAGGDGAGSGGGGSAGPHEKPLGIALPGQSPKCMGICRGKYGNSGGYKAGGGGVMFSGGTTSGAGDSTNGGDRGDEDRKLPSSEQDDAASEQGLLASLGSALGSELPSLPESGFFRLHLDWPHARKPLAKGLLSIFSFVMRSFCGQVNTMY